MLDGCLSRLPRSLSSVFILRELEDLDDGGAAADPRVSEATCACGCTAPGCCSANAWRKHWFGETRDGRRRTHESLNGLLQVLTLHCEAASELIVARAGRSAAPAGPRGALVSPPRVQLLPPVPQPDPRDSPGRPPPRTAARGNRIERGPALCGGPRPDRPRDPRVRAGTSRPRRFARLIAVPRIHRPARAGPVRQVPIISSPLRPASCLPSITNKCL